MSITDNRLATGEFSKITGLSVSAITKMLRQGKLSGEKQSGKWSIFESELKNHVGSEKKQASGKDTSANNKTQSESEFYSVEKFSQLTYLTEKGVRQWFKMGHLTGNINSDGRVMVDADNLSCKKLKNLLR